MDTRAQAEQIYQQTRPHPRAVEMGFGLTPIQSAAVDEIQAHLDLVAEIGQEYKLRLDPSKVEFGATREQIVAIAEAKVKAQKRSAGARALSRKYGKDTAEQIIYRKTGKHVTLKR